MFMIILYCSQYSYIAIILLHNVCMCTAMSFHGIAVITFNFSNSFSWESCDNHMHASFTGAGSYYRKTAVGYVLTGGQRYGVSGPSKGGSQRSGSKELHVRNNHTTHKIHSFILYVVVQDRHEHGHQSFRFRFISEHERQGILPPPGIRRYGNQASIQVDSARDFLRLYFF